MSSDPTLPPTVDEDARRRFEAAWRAGNPEPIERFLPPPDHAHFLPTLEELVAIEMEFLWKAAPGKDEDTLPADPLPRIEAYLARFPRLNRPEIVRRLLSQELSLRRRRGERPATEEYRARFPEIVGAGLEGDATLATNVPPPTWLAVLPGGQDYTARLWDAATGQPRSTPPFRHKERIDVAIFSYDGAKILTASFDNTARLWDSATGQATGPVFRHGAEIFAAAFSPDGEKVVTAGEDHRVRLWNAATGDSIGQPMQHDAAVWGAAFSPDGASLLTAGYDGTARLWDVKTGERRRMLAHQAAVWGVAFSPDGKTLLVACRDRTARLWDADAGRLQSVSLPHLDWVNAVAYSPDGKTVLTGSNDATARLWDPATGQPLDPPLTHRGWVNAVAYSLDGRTLLTGSSDHTARLWRGPMAVPGTAESLMLWVQVITGMELDKDGVVQGLSAETWQRRRQRLEELGGPPAW